MDAPDLAALRQEALQFHVQGDLQAAATRYALLLEREPENPILLHLSGVAALQAGKLPQAIDLIRRAVEYRPAPHFIANFGVALRRAGRIDEAIQALQRALALDPVNPEAHSNLANALCSVSRFEEALVAADHALARRPGMAEASLNRALALSGLGRAAEAVIAAGDALATRPAWPEALVQRGNAQLALDRLAEAIESFRQALAIQPDHYAAMVNLGSVLGRMGHLEEAASILRQAVKSNPAQAEAALNLGGVLRTLGYLEEAAQTQQALLRRDHAYWPAWSNLAAILHDQGRVAEATAAWDRTLALRPDQPDAQYSRALTLLLGGDLVRGWEALEARWHATQHKGRTRHASVPLWNGEPLAGRTILLHAEEGLGDSIQFARYVPLVAERGGRVVVETYAPLARLFASLPGVDRLVVTGEPVPVADLQCPFQSLPRAFGTDLASIPARVPYLHPPADIARAWAGRMTGPGLRVGVVWAGNPGHGKDRQRSIPFDLLGPLWAVDGVTWHSLQVGSRVADLSSADVLVEDLSPALTNFAETAAAIRTLDLVIAVDTSVAHLAGALGCEVWLLVPTAPDWRWLLDRDDSPWYPSMRLFRQPRPHDWPAVLASVAAALRQKVRMRNDVSRMVPVGYVPSA